MPAVLPIATRSFVAERKWPSNSRWENRVPSARRTSPVLGTAVARPAPTDVHVTPTREPWLRRNSAQLVMAVILALGRAITYFASRSTNPVTGEAQHVSLSP